MAPKISINQQIEEQSGTIQTTRRAGEELVRKGRMRQSELDYRLRRQEAIWKSLCWFRDSEADLKVLWSLPQADRAFILSHAPLVLDLARQIAAKEAIAKAGGPAQ